MANSSSTKNKGLALEDAYHKYPDLRSEMATIKDDLGATKLHQKYPDIPASWFYTSAFLNSLNKPEVSDADVSTEKGDKKEHAHAPHPLHSDTHPSETTIAADRTESTTPADKAEDAAQDSSLTTTQTPLKTQQEITSQSEKPVWQIEQEKKHQAEQVDTERLKWEAEQKNKAPTQATINSAIPIHASPISPTQPHRQQSNIERGTRLVGKGILWTMAPLPMAALELSRRHGERAQLAEQKNKQGSGETPVENGTDSPKHPATLEEAYRKYPQLRERLGKVTNDLAATILHREYPDLPDTWFFSAAFRNTLTQKNSRLKKAGKIAGKAALWTFAPYIPAAQLLKKGAVHISKPDISINPKFKKIGMAALWTFAPVVAAGITLGQKHNETQRIKRENAESLNNQQTTQATTVNTQPKTTPAATPKPPPRKQSNLERRGKKIGMAALWTFAPVVAAGITLGQKHNETQRIKRENAESLNNQQTTQATTVNTQPKTTPAATPKPPPRKQSNLERRSRLAGKAALWTFAPPIAAGKYLWGMYGQQTTTTPQENTPKQSQQQAQPAPQTPTWRHREGGSRFFNNPISRGIDRLNNFTSPTSRAKNFAKNKLANSAGGKAARAALKNQLKKRAAGKLLLKALSWFPPVRLAILIFCAVLLLCCTIFIAYQMLTGGFSQSSDTSPTVTTQTGQTAQNTILSLTKEGPTDAVDYGVNVPYTLTVTYNGEGSANIVLTDPIPNGLTFKNASDNGKNNNGTVEWTLTGIAKGASKAVTLTLYLPKHPKVTITQIDNTATATVTNSSGGGTDNGGSLPPITGNCSGKITPSYSLICTEGNPSPFNNYGDPACNFSVNKMDAAIKNQDAANFAEWHFIALHESTPGGPTGPNACLMNSASGHGAFGLYQMNQKGYNVDTFGYDRGDVNWPVQISNAINYYHKWMIPHGQSFGKYWQSAQ